MVTRDITLTWLKEKRIDLLIFCHVQNICRKIFNLFKKNWKTIDNLHMPKWNFSSLRWRHLWLLLGTYKIMWKIYFPNYHYSWPYSANFVYFFANKNALHVSFIFVTIHFNLVMKLGINLFWRTIEDVSLFSFVWTQCDI